MAGIRGKRKAATRATILRCAVRHFRCFGFEAAGMDEIADEAEVAVGTLYNYFGFKRGLLMSTVEGEIAQTLQEMTG